MARYNNFGRFSYFNNNAGNNSLNFGGSAGGCGGGFGGGRGGGRNGPVDNNTNDTLVGGDRSDFLNGRGGNDTLLDAGGWRNVGMDTFLGGAGDDRITTRWGKDIVQGGDGNDFIMSRSDGGEPLIAQNPAMRPYNNGQPFGGNVSNDILSGGNGADTFMFRLDLNARSDIIAKHVNDAGDIDWEGVTGENGGTHLHWVDTIGTDVITDFSKAQGDKIKIEGHTAQIAITYSDLNRDGKMESLVKITSNQGAGGGSHNGDTVGTIIVYGDQVTAADISVNAGAHHGAFGNISDILFA